MEHKLLEHIPEIQIAPCPPQDAEFNGIIAGQQVFFETTGNDEGRYEGLNHDRAAFVSLEGVSKADLEKVADTGMGAAETAVQDLSADLWENAKQRAISEGKYNEKTDEIWDYDLSSSTGLIAVYDPDAFTLDIRSRGDSPAYLILSDGDKHVSVQLSFDGDHERNVLFNDMSRNNNAVSPRRVATYSFDAWQAAQGKHQHILPDHSDGKIHTRIPLSLDSFIQEAAERYGMDPTRASLTLTLTTDGADTAVKWEKDNEALRKQAPPAPAKMGLTQRLKQRLSPPPMPDKLHFPIIESQLATTIAKSDNPAYAVVKAALKNGTSDNVTAAVIPLQKGKGQPIAVMLADGLGTEGNKCAEAAVQAFAHALAQLRQPTATMHAHTAISGLHRER